MVYKQRTLGAIPAFLTGLATSLFIFNYLKDKPGEDSALVTIGTSIEKQRPTWMYLNESVSDVNSVGANAVRLSPKKDTLTLLVLVFSAPDAKHMRQAVRSTWASDLKARDNVMYFFVINVLHLSRQHLRGLGEEDETHGDMMFLSEKPSLMPNSQTLLRALNLVHKFTFKFLLKCNDGSYVRVPEILHQLEEVSSTELVWGFFAGNETVGREGPHTEKTWNLCIKYLPYPQGGGYILSHDIVSMLVVMGPDLSHLDNEDIAIGVWLTPFNIQRRHDVRFNTGLMSRGCNNTYLITHGETVKSMIEKHQSLQRHGTLCTLEHQNMLSYVYNWSAPMSDCCIPKNGIP